MGKYARVFQETVKEFGEDKARRLGAALAYYTIFALTPGLVIVMALAGVLLGPGAENQIIGQMWVDRANMASYDTGGGVNANMTAWRTRVANTLPGITVGSTNSPTITVAGTQVIVTLFWKMPGADSLTRQFSIVAQINDS